MIENTEKEVNLEEQEVTQDATPSEEAVVESTQPTKEEESYKEMYVRLNADFQNYKRRVEKERIEWMQSSQVMLLEKLLPVFDELDRALELAVGKDDNNQPAWLEGFQLIQKNLQKELSAIGVKEISTAGAFDPALHEALMHEAAEDKKAGEIVNVFSKGYMLNDKVIKHAKVSVAQ